MKLWTPPREVFFEINSTVLNKYVDVPKQVIELRFLHPISELIFIIRRQSIGQWQLQCTVIVKLALQRHSQRLERLAVGVLLDGCMEKVVRPAPLHPKPATTGLANVSKLAMYGSTRCTREARVRGDDGSDGDGGCLVPLLRRGCTSASQLFFTA